MRLFCQLCLFEQTSQIQNHRRFARRNRKGQKENVQTGRRRSHTVFTGENSNTIVCFSMFVCILLGFDCTHYEDEKTYESQCSHARSHRSGVPRNKTQKQTKKLNYLTGKVAVSAFGLSHQKAN
jgi:hypothetical protein